MNAKLIDFNIKALLFLCMSITLVTTTTVIVLLGKESIEFFKVVPVFDFLFGREWAPLLEPKSFGVLPLVFGTLKIVVGATVLALPAGIMVAIFLSEYASERIRGVVKPILELLAGIPTVVYGFFAITFITPIMQFVYPETQIFNAASGAIVVAIMILPMISSLCDDAFQSVHPSLREGGYALGASTFEVISAILIPSAITRIGAATILAVSRAIGETMAVTLAAGATPSLGMSPFESIQTMTAYIVQVSLGDTPQGGIEYMSIFAVGTLLFVMTLVMNIIGNNLIFKSRGDSL